MNEMLHVGFSLHYDNGEVLAATGKFCYDCNFKCAASYRIRVFIYWYTVQTHRMQLATGTPSGRCEWNFRCCFALELPTLYDDVKV